MQVFFQLRYGLRRMSRWPTIRVRSYPALTGDRHHGRLPQFDSEWTETSSVAHEPSTSLLFSFKKLASHDNGFSGSCAAKYFMPSKRWGVTFVLRKSLVGPPWATGFSGLTLGCGGWEFVRVGFADAGGGTRDTADGSCAGTGL